MKENLRNKGITLIALIITIIVLLLIAGITISTLMGDHGILTQAKESKVTSIEARVDEEIELAIQTANMAIRRQTAENNSWSAQADGIKPETAIAKTATSSLIDEATNGVVLAAIAGDLNKDGYTIQVTAKEETGTRIIEIEYAGEDYQKAKGDENAKRTKYIEVSQSMLALTSCRHTWNAGEVTTEATCTAKGVKTYKCTKCGETKTEAIAKLAHTYNASGVCTVCGAEKQELVIGANINYHEYIGENGNALSTMPTYSTQKLGSSYNKTYTVKAPVEDETPMQWIVLGEENGQIKITTKDYVKPTSGTTLTLYEQDGYANFVDELNKISAIYGKGKYADTSKFTVEGVGTGGRSFIMEDLGYNSLTRTGTAHTYAKHSDGKIYEYAADATPNGESTIGGNSTDFWYTDMDASNSTEEPATNEWHNLKDATGELPSVTIYPYTYSGSRTLSTDISKTASGVYWLASRYVVYEGPGYVIFVARCNSIYDNCSHYWYNSYGYSNNDDSCGVRPVVYLKSDIQLTYDATNGYTIEETT